MDNSHEVFARNLKRYLRINNKNQQDITMALGVSKQTVSDWACGKKYPRINKIQDLADFFGIYKSDLTEEKGGVNVHQGIKIPVYNSFFSNVPDESTDDIDSYISIDIDMAKSGHFFAYKVSDDSMSPKISLNDTVIVQCSEKVNNDQLALVKFNDTLTIRKVQSNDVSIVFIPFNISSSPEIHNKSDLSQKGIVIIGRVVELRAKF